MPFTSESATGRPKGAENKETKAIRESFRLLVENNLANMQDWLEATAATNPAKALQIVSDIAQYSLPKLKQVDATVDIGDSLIQKITVEVANGKRTEDTSNNSISA